MTRNRLVLPPSASFSRRRFLGRAGLTIGGLGLAPALLAACGDDDDAPAAGGDTGGSGGGGNSVYHANWPAYMDDESVALFAAETGIDLRYTEEISDNAELFALIQPILANGDAIDQDIITPSMWMAARLINLGWVEPLPLDLIPNAGNLAANLVNPPWDPTGEFSLPWQSGFGGIAYNLDVTGRELTSTLDLLDPAFSGKIGLLSEMRDTVGLFMMATGKTLANPTFADAEEAFALLEEAVASGQIRAFTGNDYMDDLASGNFAACVGWSGDIAQIALDNPAVRFVVPDEGGTLWSDVMVIPKGAANVDAAAAWMNYCYDPVNAARITNFVQYVSPVDGVAAELTALGSDAAALVDNPLVFPNAELLSRVQSWGLLSDDDEIAFDARFGELQGA